MPFNGLEFLPTATRTHIMGVLAFVCAVFLLFGQNFAKAQENPAVQKAQATLQSAVLKDDANSLPLGRYTLVINDPSMAITPEKIIQTGGSILNGKPLQTDSVFLNHEGGSKWLVTKIQNNSTQKDWVFDFGRQFEGRTGNLKSVNVYKMDFVQNPDAVQTINLTPLVPLAQGGAYKIQTQEQEQTLVLVNIQGVQGLPSNLPLTLSPDSVFFKKVAQQSFLNTLYGMILIGFFAAFLSLSFIGNRNENLFYASYFLCAAIFWTSYTQISSTQGHENFLNFIVIGMLSFSMFHIFLTKFFCKIDYTSYTERYILYALLWLNILYSILFLLLPTTMTPIQVLTPYSGAIVTVVITAMMMFARMRNGLMNERLLFYGNLIVGAGLIITVFSSYGFVTPKAWTLYAFWFSLPMQGLMILSYAPKHIRRHDQDAHFSKHKGFENRLNLQGVEEAKDYADHSRLLRVIEKEREMLAEFRKKEALRTEEMRLAKEEADEANRAKSAFLAVVSHEIRTPMTGIMGMVRLLLDSNISRQQRDYVMTIQESSDAMLALLNDILDFEKIQQGKIDLENISFDLHRLVQGIITLMSGHAAGKRISLSARMDDNIPRFVKGDPTRLRQVLLNLMGNALKFTDKGSVTLLVKNLSTNAENQSVGQTNLEKSMIYFGVQDTGIGISAEAQKNLFNPFSQANSSIARKFGGTGLGLAISKGLIERMGSSININSKEGEGSTFFFSLEMAKGQTPSSEQVSSVPQKVDADIIPLKIMVVDDNAITRKVVSGFLNGTPHEVEGYGSAEEALDRIYRYVYDLIFMDIELPGMKGNEAVKLLREYDDPAKAQIPVIAMTGNVRKEDMEAYLTDGMSGFITKPLDPDKLRDIVNEVAMNSFEREIKAPGATLKSPWDDIEGLEPLPSFPDEAQIKALEETVAQKASDGVFDPLMLQSLKDTIGVKPLTELLDDLIIKTDELLAAMDNAAQNGDMKSLAARAHELKGMAGNFGLVEISTLAAQTEKKAKLEVKEGLDDLLQSFDAASQRAQDVLKNWVAH